MMQALASDLFRLGVVPVVRIDKEDDAVPLARALRDGGIPCAEITFRTPAALESIRRIAAECPGVTLGAGTVLSTEQVDAAVEAGARFVVTPGFDAAVVRHCLDKGVPVLPGCSNPTDLSAACAHGLEIVKFFPAETLGGVDAIKALAAPYGGLKFVPTGGVNAANLQSYLACDAVLACGGSWMVPPALIRAGSFDEITRLTREAVAAMLSLSVVHIGVNTADAPAAHSLAAQLADTFALPVKEGNSSVFAGTLFEVMKAPGRGAHGHIAVGTPSPDRAVAYLAARGVAFDESTAARDETGKRKSIYLAGEFGGFAVHLLRI